MKYAIVVPETGFIQVKKQQAFGPALIGEFVSLEDAMKFIARETGAPVVLEVLTGTEYSK